MIHLVGRALSGPPTLPDLIRSGLHQLPDDPSPRDVLQKAKSHSIADQDSHEIAIDPIRDMRRDPSAALELHPIQRARQLLGDDAS
jgi:hypothetical protein